MKEGGSGRVRSADIPRWEGPGKQDATGWLDIFELHARVNRWDMGELVDVVGIAFSKCSKGVRTWYTGQLKELDGVDESRRWRVFRSRFVKKFTKKDGYGQSTERWLSTKQKVGESVHDYAERYEVAVFAVEEQEQQGGTIPKWRRQVRNLFMRNLLPELREAVVGRRPKTFERAVDAAKEVEEWKMESNGSRGAVSKRKKETQIDRLVAAVEAQVEKREEEETREEMQVAAARQWGQQQSWGKSKGGYNGGGGKKCYRCGVEGHIVPHCPQPPPPVVCFACGEEGHKWEACQKKGTLKCDYCGTAGHLEKVCSKKRDDGGGVAKGGPALQRE
jgi:hypothetical protein